MKRVGHYWEKVPSNLPDSPGRAVPFLALGVVLSGLVVFIAWTIGSPAAANLLPGFPSMCRTTAVGFIMAGGSLLLLGRNPIGKAWKPAGYVFALLTALLGAIALGEYGLGRVPSADAGSIFRAIGPVGEESPRVAVSTAISFVLSGTALLLLDWVGPRGLRLSQHLAVAVLVVAFVSLAGYILNEPLTHSYFYTGMALNTSITFVLLGVGVLLARRDAGLMGVLLSPSVGGVMIRHLLPPLVVVPPFLGWLGIELQANRVLAHEIIEPITSVFGAVVAAAVVWMFARTLNREDERRQASEGALSESEANFRALSENAQDGIIVAVGENAGYVYANPQFARMIGYSAEDLGGRSFRDLIAPEEEGKIAERYARFKSGEPISPVHETLFVRKDGTRLPVEVTDAGITWKGEPAVFAIVRDISERKRMETSLRQSEESFRALADNANDSIVILVEGEKHVYANHAASEMLGYTVDELLTKTPRDVVHPDEYPKLSERFRKRLAGEEVPNRYETILVHKDGRAVPVDVTVARSTWRGRPASIVVTRDMTEKKHGEEERSALYQQNRALIRQLLHLQEEERKRLAQEIHDDLGQALTAIMTNARLIAKKCPECSPEYVEAADEIVSIADGVYESVQRMSRRLRPSALDDLGLMDALRTMVETSPLKKAGVDFTISFGGDLNSIEDAVSIALYRVLQECLTNISKHSGADHVTIRLQRNQADNAAAKGDSIDLAVEDNGRGTDQARVSRGLGLIGIRERVETLGGEFHLFSAPGKGTSVRVSLPVCGSMERAGV